MRGDHILLRMHLPGSALQLALLRIAVGLHVFYAVNSRIFDLLQAAGQRQDVSTLFPQRLDDLIAAHALSLLVPLCSVLSLAMVLGLFTRYVLPLLTLAYLLLSGHYYHGVNAPINWLYLWFPMLVMCFGASADVWSVDVWFRKRRGAASALRPLVRYRWPVELMVMWFVYIYFAAGVAKVVPLDKGFDWLMGQTSKEIIYHRYLDSPFHYLFGQPFFDYSKGALVFGLLSIAALLLELGTVIMLLTARYNILILVLIACMHVFLYLTGVAGFLQTALVLGLALLPPAIFDRLGAAVDALLGRGR